MSKLIKLKEFITKEEAALYLSELIQEDVLVDDYLVFSRLPTYIKSKYSGFIGTHLLDILDKKNDYPTLRASILPTPLVDMLIKDDMDSHRLDIRPSLIDNENNIYAWSVIDFDGNLDANIIEQGFAKDNLEYLYKTKDIYKFAKKILADEFFIEDYVPETAYTKVINSERESITIRAMATCNTLSPIMTNNDFVDYIVREDKIEMPSNAGAESADDSKISKDSLLKIVAILKNMLMNKKQLSANQESIINHIITSYPQIRGLSEKNLKIAFAEANVVLNAVELELKEKKIELDIAVEKDNK